MDKPLVGLAIADGVATLSIDRPESLNALNLDVARAMKSALLRVAGDSSARVVVVRGVGRAFCAGGDVKEMNAIQASNEPDAFFKKPLAEIHQASTLLFELPKPTIAVVQGFATGAGMNLALCCDFRIAASNARMNQAFITLGLVPDTGGSWTLPRLVGLAKATELMFFGDFIDGTEAERLGIVNRAVAAERLDEEVATWVKRLAAAPTRAIGQIKALLRTAYQNSFAAQAEAERLAQVELALETEDYHEGFRAFFEKRPPKFLGR